MQWIKTSERLPEDGVDIIIYGTSKCGNCDVSPRVIQGLIYDGIFVYGEYRCPLECTHWMPMPQPPSN